MTEQIEKLDIEKFSPAISEIKKIVDEGRGITVSDFTNKAQIKLVKDQRIKLRDIRTSISKQGKAFRQEANDFSKAVIAKEKELIGMIEPEEERLASLEDQADKEKELAERRELLPKRKEKLTSIGDDIEISEADILDMDNSVFDDYCNQRFAAKNENDRLALEAKGRELKEAEMKQVREKEIKEAEDRARSDERKRVEEAEVNLKAERERIEKEAKERIEREERESKMRIELAEKEAKERLEREEREREKKIEAEAEAEAERKVKLAKTVKWQEFILSHGYTEEKAGDFYIEVKGNIHSLYKKVGEITL